MEGGRVHFRTLPHWLLQFFHIVQRLDSSVFLYAEVKRGGLIELRWQNQAAANNNNNNTIYYFTVFKVLMPVFDPLNDYGGGRAVLLSFRGEEVKSFLRASVDSFLVPLSFVTELGGEPRYPGPRPSIRHPRCHQNLAPEFQLHSCSCRTKLPTCASSAVWSNIFIKW